MGQNNYEGFLERYVNEIIRINSTLLDRKTRYFKEECNNLGIEFSVYGHLPKIERLKHLEPWKNVGKTLIEITESGKIATNDSSRKMAAYYIHIAETLKDKLLLETALELGEKILENDEKRIN